MTTANKKIRTIHDVLSTNSVSSSSNNAKDLGHGRIEYGNAKISEPKLYHMEKLDNADTAKVLLERVVKEFVPIMQRRGYNVASVSEFCCCGDGLDTVRRRKLRRQQNNILGYNQTISHHHGKKYHEIHLRLRHVQGHASRFFPYEDVAGTMAHELAHCERGPHDETFFKIMETILDEHATLMASGLTTQGGLAPMLPFSGAGQRLGGVQQDASQNDKSKSILLTGRALGGDREFQQWMTPAEAAVAAAQARQRQLLRLRANQCCRPCTIEVRDSDDENDDDTSGNITDDVDAKPAAAKHKTSGGTPQSKKTRIEPACIDLTNLDDDSISDGGEVNLSPVAILDYWPCHRCTFLNPAYALACSMCAGERVT